MEERYVAACEKCGPGAAQYYGARVNLRLPPGPQKVAIGLWDETAAIGSFISRSLDVG